MVVLRDEVGNFYAGFMDGAPVRVTKSTRETKMEESIADMVLKQLEGLGFVGWKKEQVR